MLKNNSDTDADIRLRETVELALLYDFYGELLKEHTKEIFEDYVLNDYSLGEIAEKINISRQGVYDIVKRCGRQLKSYENKLHLVDKYNKQKQAVSNLEAKLGFVYENEHNEELKQKLIEIKDELIHQFIND